eukprot:6873463-Alexandrium_andersonii.AAC.1
MDEAPWQELAASAQAWRESFEQGQASAAAASSTDNPSAPSAQPTGSIPMSDFDLRLRVKQAASVDWIRALLADHQ